MPAFLVVVIGLNGWGYAVIEPSSFLPRSVYSGVCSPDQKRMVTPRDRAGDVAAHTA
jgi:hypothetical protein